MKNLMTALITLSFALSASGSGVYEKIQRDIDRVQTEVAQEIEQRVRTVRDVESADEAKAEAQEAIQETRTRYEALLAEVQSDASELDQNRLALEAEKAQLEADKDTLELQKELFSTGLYASLGTMFLGVVTVLVRRPVVKAELILRKLEIEEKQLHIAALKRKNGD